MAARASERGLPPELPVMAALVESDMANLGSGDRDSVGFFQMRAGIWNEGEYAGYPDEPETQLASCRTGGMPSTATGDCSLDTGRVSRTCSKRCRTPVKNIRVPPYRHRTSGLPIQAASRSSGSGPCGDVRYSASARSRLRCRERAARV